VRVLQHDSGVEKPATVSIRVAPGAAGGKRWRARPARCRPCGVSATFELVACDDGLTGRDDSKRSYRGQSLLIMALPPRPGLAMCRKTRSWMAADDAACGQWQG